MFLLKRLQGFWLLSLLPPILLIAVPAVAQRVTPTQDGTGTVVTQQGNRIDISGGTLSRDNANLFHSFEQFGLSREQIATFLSRPDVRNILARVSGGDASVINGLIRVTGGNSNLYLMNPAGIVFGPNAQLNVPSSFTATTANGIQFGSEWFSALGNSNYANLVGEPSGFGFTLGQPGAIINAGDLAVGTGQSLNLLGGTVVNTGNLTAPGGQILITAIPGSRLVRLSIPGHLLSLTIDPTTLSSNQPNAWTLPVTALPILLTTGASGLDLGVTAGSDGTIRLSNSGLNAPANPGTAIASGTLNVSGQRGGEVGVFGNRVGLVNAQVNASGTDGGGNVRVGGDYQGSGIVPNATQTFVSRDSTINADAVNSGNGGRVIVWANGTTEFYGSISATGGFALGNGGFVEVSGKENLIFDGAANLSTTNGDFGTLLLDPENITIVSGDGGLNSAQLNANVPNQDDLSGTILAEDGIGTFTISQNSLEALQGNANIRLESTNNITVNPLSNNTLTFQGGTGTIIFTADSDQNGVGNFSMEQNQAVVAPGRNLTIQGANITVGDINTAGVALNIAGNPGSSGGQVNLAATSGSILAGNITASGGAGGNGGDGLPGGNGGNGGNGSQVSLTANTGSILTGNISTSGGVGGNGGNGFLGGNGGNGGNGSSGGQVSLTANTGSILTGNISTSGGVGGNGGNGGIGGPVSVFSIPNGAGGNGGDGSNGNLVSLLTASGGITTGNIVTAGSAGGAGRAGATIQGSGIGGTIGGSVSFTASGTISAGSINSSASSYRGGVIGGAINLSTGGSITLGNIDSSSNTTLPPPGAPRSLGGRPINDDPIRSLTQGVSLRANGEILVGDINASISRQDVSDDFIVDNSVTLSAGQRIEVGNLDTSATAPARVNPQGGAVTLQTNSGNSSNIRFNSISTQGIAQGVIDASTTGIGGNVSLVANGTVRGTGTVPTSPGNTILTAGTSQSGSVTIQHDGGQNNTRFVVGDATINGTAGGINTGRQSIAGTTIPNQNTVPQIPNNNVFTQGDTTAGDIRVTFINQAPTLRASARLGETQINQPITFRVSDLNPTVRDVNDDNTSIEIASINQGGTLRRADGSIVRAGVAVSLNERLTYQPPQDTTGSIEAFSIRANDNVSFSDAVALNLNIRPLPTEPPSPPTTDPPTSSSPNLSATLPCDSTSPSIFKLEEDYSREFKQYLDANSKPDRDLVDTCTLLTNIGSATGIRPAVIYANFVPASISAEQYADSDRPLQPRPDDQLELVLVTANAVPYRQRIPDATRERVQTLAKEFSQQVAIDPKNRTTDFRPDAQQLYQWLIQPLENQLQAQEVENLVFILDQGLRSVPVAALMYKDVDGKDHYLVERYSVGLTPSLSLTDTRYQNLKNSEVLAMGASTFPNQNQLDLPTVETQISSILNLWQGKGVLNPDFTYDNLRRERQQQPFGIVHLATHADFKAGDPTLSYIQLESRKLFFNSDDIRSLGWNNPPVQLLVLSACNTALGDAQSELGFAGLAYRTGVTSAVASLWTVSQNGTLPLMVEFYRQLRQAPIKAEALRQAQISMIQGEITYGSEVNGDGYILLPDGSKISIKGLEDQLGSPNLADPFYWSAFTMIGSPW